MPELLGREMHLDGTVVHSRLVMNTSIRQAILVRNKELRKNPGAIQDLSFGRMELSIPELDYWHIRKKWPGMFDGDIETRKAQLQRFMASPESAPYKVR